MAAGAQAVDSAPPVLHPAVAEREPRAPRDRGGHGATESDSDESRCTAPPGSDTGFELDSGCGSDGGQDGDQLGAAGADSEGDESSSSSSDSASDAADDVALAACGRSLRAKRPRLVPSATAAPLATTVAARYGHGAIAAAVRGHAGVVSVPFEHPRALVGGLRPQIVGALAGIAPILLYCVTWSSADGEAAAIWLPAALVPISLRLALLALDRPVRTPAPRCILASYPSKASRLRALAGLETAFVATNGTHVVRPPPPWSTAGMRLNMVGGLAADAPPHPAAMV